MTAVPVVDAVGPVSVRAGRVAARVAVSACVVLFLGGIVLWARDGRAAAALWALPASWSEAALGTVTAEVGLSPVAVSAYVVLLELVVAAAGITAAVLLLRGDPGWFRLYVAVALALWATLGGAMSVVYRDALGGTGGEAVALLQGVGWVAVFPLAYVFPDGRFVPRWTRWCALAWVAYLPYTALLWVLGLEPDPESLLETAPLLVLFGTAAYAAAHRYRRLSTPEQRRQTRGIVTALVLWFAVVLLAWAPPLSQLMEQLSVAGLTVNAGYLAVSYLVAALLPVSIAVAILRYRLYEIDVWVNRTRVYGALTVGVVLVYAAVAGLGGMLWPGTALAGPLLATVVIAVALHPLRLRAHRAVDRFVYGRRHQPYAVLSDLGRRLESVVPPDEVLATLVREVAGTLRLPYVAASSGAAGAVHPPSATRPAGMTETFPLRWQGEDLGTLTVAPAPGDRLSAADRDLLDGLARQAGAAVRAAALNDDLRRSRTRILVAREDERRRLQRDLHDGLGPTLASLYQRVDAAHSVLPADPQAAKHLLADVGDQTRAVIGDIRGLVRALRPPELDELGLARAVEAAASHFDGLRVVVSAEALGTLPAVVETTAYRIAVEALTNVTRHSGARCATVTLARSAYALDVEVVDDGRGFPAGTAAGTGLRSMRERADELGGSCSVASLGGGTRMHCVLPLGTVG